MSLSLRQWWRHNWLAVAAGVTLLAVIAVLVMFRTPLPQGDLHGAKGEKIGEGVTVSGQAIPDGLKVTQAEPEAAIQDMVAGKKRSFFRQLAFLEIGPYHGALQKPMRVTVPVKDMLVDDKHALVVMTRPVDGGEWTRLEPINPKSGDKTVTVEMTHLSILAVFNVFTDDFIKSVAYLLESEAFNQAEFPKCPHPDKPSADRYKLKRPSTDALLTCIGHDGKNYVMHVVNNRRYPLDLSWSHGRLLTDGKYKLDMLELYRLRNKETPILRPGEEAVFTIDALEDGDTATVSTNLSSWTLAVDTLGRVANASLFVVYGPGKKAKDGAESIVSKMLGNVDCYNAADGANTNLVTVLNACFKVNFFVDVLGVGAGILLTPVVAIIATLDTSRLVANAVADIRKKRDEATASVSRTRRQPAETGGLFPGEWARYQPDGEVRTVLVGEDGAMIYFAGISGCPGRGRCDFTANLVPEQAPNGEVVARVKQAGYAVGGHEISTPPSFEEDSLQVGDEAKLFVDDKGRLVVEYLGRFSDMNDLDNDGLIDDANHYCSFEDKESDRKVCGHSSWAKL